MEVTTKQLARKYGWSIALILLCAALSIAIQLSIYPLRSTRDLNQKLTRGVLLRENTLVSLSWPFYITKFGAVELTVSAAGLSPDEEVFINKIVPGTGRLTQIDKISEGESTVPIPLGGGELGLHDIRIDLQLRQKSSHLVVAENEESVTWDVLPSISDRLILFLEIFVPSAGLSWCIRLVVLWMRGKSTAVEEKVAVAEAKAEKEPEKAKYAWDVARANLELYFERNRLQVSQVFFIAIAVMIVGFGFVCFGVYLPLQNKGITASLVAGISGVITQFIGATFMVIYRSTMTQANEFMLVLERINTVGMAVQVLDSIPEDEKQLKNETRAQIVSLLLNANISSKTTTAKKSKAAIQGQ